MTRFPLPQRQPIVRQVCISLALIIATVCVYLPVRHHGFVNLDDNEFVTENSNIRDGLTGRSARWALTAGFDPQGSACRLLEASELSVTRAGHRNVRAASGGASSDERRASRRGGGGAVPGAAVDDECFLALRFGGGAVCAAPLARRVGGLGDGTQGRVERPSLHADTRAYVGYVRHPFSWARYLAVALWFALG